MNTEVIRATSARKTFFSQRALAREQYHDFEVEIAGKWFPVGDQQDEVSNCFNWQSDVDDERYKRGTPKSPDDAEAAARLVRKHLNKTDYEPTL